MRIDEEVLLVLVTKSKRGRRITGIYMRPNNVVAMICASIKEPCYEVGVGARRRDRGFFRRCGSGTSGVEVHGRLLAG